MTKKVNITPEESENVERLFTTYNAYMSMLEYLASSGIQDSPMYDKKWNEACELWIQLDKAKRKVEYEYKPEGDWDSYEFDFDNYQVVFVKNEA